MKAKDTITIIFSCVFLFLIALIIALNPISPIYNYSINSNPTAYLFGIPQTQSATNQIVMYLWFGKSYEIELSPQAQNHMRDVRVLFIIGQLVFTISCVSLFLLLKHAPNKEKKKIFNLASKINVSLLAITFLFSLVGFDKLFTLFHQILFRNSDWLFSPNDALIIYFPQYFFITIAKILAIWFTIFFVVVITISRDTKKRVPSGKTSQHI